jgi:hypothetical protein
MRKGFNDRTLRGREVSVDEEGFQRLNAKRSGGFGR